jgi:uncharacterized membrane protein YdjX (TVP38/TMEM64 family)
MNKKLTFRLLLLTTLTIVLMAAAKYAFGDALTYQNLQSLLQDAGFLGVGLFLGVCIIGSLLHIPAYVLLAMCFLIYSGLPGFAVGIAAAFAIFTSHFFFARVVGGNALEHIKHPYFIKKLNSLGHQPLKSIILIRLVFFMAPLINFALGLSSIRYRDFIIGSLLGISIHFTAIFLLVHFSRDRVMTWLG